MNRGSSLEHEIDFGAGAVHLDAAYRMQKLGGQFRCRHHLQESTFRVGVRQHHASTNFRAVFEHDAARPAIANIDLRDWRRGADLNSKFSPRCGQRLGDGAHAAHDVSVEALQFVLAAAQEMKEQTNRGARLVRAAMLAIHIVGKEHGLDLFGFVVVIEKFAEASGQKGNKLRHFVAGDAAKFLAHAKKIAPAAHGPGIDFRRRLHEEGLQVAREFFQPIIDFDESVRIFRGNLFKFSPGSFAIGPPGNDMAIRKRHLDGGIARNHAQSIIAKAQIRNHFRTQHAGDIRCGGHAAAGSDLFGDATAADDFPPFKHESGEPGAGKISGRGETIVTTADDDRVVGFRVAQSRDGVFEGSGNV